MQSVTETVGKLACFLRARSFYGLQLYSSQFHSRVASEASCRRLCVSREAPTWKPSVDGIHASQHRSPVLSYILRDAGVQRASAVQIIQRRTLHHSSSAAAESSTKDRTTQTDQRQSIVYQDDEYSDISTKVTPVSRPEAAGWSVVILAAYGVSAFLLYLVYSQFFVETPETAVFNRALDTVRDDFRVTALLGSTIKGYGGEGGRHQRRHISHNSYMDSNQIHVLPVNELRTCAKPVRLEPHHRCYYNGPIEDLLLFESRCIAVGALSL